MWRKKVQGALWDICWVFLLLLSFFSHTVLCSTRFKESLPWPRSSISFIHCEVSRWWSFLDFPVMANDSNCLHPSILHFNQRLPSPHRSTTKGSLSISYPSEVAIWHIKLKCHWFQLVLTQQAVMYVSQSLRMKKLWEVSASRVPILYSLHLSS